MAAVQQQQPAALAAGLGRLRVRGEDSLGILLLAEVPARNPPLSSAALNHWPLFSRRFLLKWHLVIAVLQKAVDVRAARGAAQAEPEQRGND